MIDTARWAIYYAPKRDDALWERGVSWLGRDPEDDREFDPRADLDTHDWMRLTATPSRYGWHATLKPPMRLRETGREDELRYRLRAFAANRVPFELPPLAVRSLDGFLALTLQKRCHELQSLADDCVRKFDDLRAPPTAQELTQRRQAGLSPRQEALLERWGYPYVFGEYRFHLTLTGRLQATEVGPVLETLQKWFAPALGKRRRVDGVALYHQAEADAAFRLVERVPFGGVSAF